MQVALADTEGHESVLQGQLAETQATLADTEGCESQLRMDVSKWTDQAKCTKAK